MPARGLSTGDVDNPLPLWIRLPRPPFAASQVFHSPCGMPPESVDRFGRAAEGMWAGVHIVGQDAQPKAALLTTRGLRPQPLRAVHFDGCQPSTDSTEVTTTAE